MKKLWIAALAAGWTLAAQAGLGILWTTGGWVVAAGGDANAGPGVAASDVVTWQLVYAGANGVPDAIDYWADGWTGGDDVLLAERVVPAGGGTAADGTSWDEWLMPQDGFAAYLDPAWPADRGGYVFQRIFQGAPSQGTPYAESGLFAFDPAFAGEGAPPDVFEFPADGGGLVLERTVPPSARKYPLWIGGVQVTDDNKTNLTAAIVAAGGAATGTATYDPDENVLTLADFRYAGAGQNDGSIWSALFYNGTNDFVLALSGSNRLEQTGASGYSDGVFFDIDMLNVRTPPTVTLRSSDGGILSAVGGTASGISAGLYAYNANIVVSGAVVNATGGAASDYSYGVSFDWSILTIESGALTATGGRAGNYDSCGIYFDAESLGVRGGTLTAIGGDGARASHGICGRNADFSTISVSGGLLVAEGMSEAIVETALSAADGMEVRAGASKTDAVAVEGDGWREKNYVEVGPPPAVTLSTPGGLATFSEGSTGPALGRIDVGLTTLPTADITVHLDVRRVGASTDNYPLPELSSYYIEFGSGSPRSQSVYFEWLDGTSAGASDGYLLTAFVTNATPGPSGVPWKDLYAPGAMTNYVANEAPRITSFAPTDASPVVAGVPFTISYSLKDVPADFSAGLTLAWTTSEGFTTSYQVSATSVSNYVAYAATSPPFTFSSAGPHSVSLVVEDKDQGTSETAVFDVTVLPPPVPPSVSNVVARQRWPWNGLVDVDYEVGGDTNLLANLAARITFAASDGRSWTATNFLAGAEPSAEPGPHRATWDTAADGVTNVVAANVVATVCLEKSKYAWLYLVTEDYTVSDDGTQILDRYGRPVDPADLPTRQTIEFGTEHTFKVIGAVPDAASPGSVLYSVVEDAEPVLVTDADTIANAGFRVAVDRAASAGDTATIQAVRHGVKSGVMTIAAVPFESIFVCNGEWVLSDDGSKLYDSNYPDDPNDWDFVGFIFDDFLVGVNFGIGAFNNTDVSFQLIAVDTVQEKLVRIDVKDNPGDEDAKVLLSGDHPESGTLNLAGSCVHVNADATSGALVFVSARYRGLESDPNRFTITVH